MGQKKREEQENCVRMELMQSKKDRVQKFKEQTLIYELIYCMNMVGSRMICKVRNM